MIGSITPSELVRVWTEREALRVTRRELAVAVITADISLDLRCEMLAAIADVDRRCVEITLQLHREGAQVVVPMQSW